MRRNSQWILFAIILITYLLGLTNSFSEERGFLVTQDSNISEPYKYIDFVGNEYQNSTGFCSQDNMTEYTKRCIDGLISKAKASGADGIISLTLQSRYYIPNGWHSYVCEVYCRGMAIKRGSTQ